MDPAAESNSDQAAQIPGLGLPIDYELPREKRFVHGVSEWTQNPRLTAKETSMLRLMNALTDKPNWNQKIFDPEIISRWKTEALALPLISDAAWRWCLAELQDKARYFERNGFVLTFDTGSRCAKSDTLIDSDLRDELYEAVKPLLEQEEKDWHPNTNDQVLNLVHPSLFPLIYGRSLVTESNDVGLDNFMDNIGHGKTLPPNQEVRDMVSRGGTARWYYEFSKPWSNTFQWLPCEVKFTEQSRTDVRVASYINNLHPRRHRALYTLIEKMIAKSIPLWNEILIRDEYLPRGDPRGFHLHGRTPPRIQTSGHESIPPAFPEWGHGIPLTPGEPGHEEAIAKVKEYLKQPDNPDRTPDYDDHEWQQKVEEGTWIEDEEAYEVLDWKFKRIRKVIHPEPGVAYSFEDWKAGKTGASVIPGRGRYGSSARPHDYYDINLEDEFRGQGLQVIVKLASIELSPEKPDYPGGNWHLEGMLNEHIVATSIYYYDVSNTTESHIRFRQEALLDEMSLDYEQSDHEPLAEIFGTESMSQEPAVQELGVVSTPQGRLLCFPNTLQHQVEPFSLADKTRPGHRRFLVLWLVDPHYKIVSTANVPPQQHHWWWEPGMLHSVLDSSGLPPELQDMVRDATGGWPIEMDEAKELRLQLMAERTGLMPSLERNFHKYNLCEH